MKPNQLTSGVFVELKPERTEKVVIDFELEHEVCQRHREAIQILRPDFPLDAVKPEWLPTFALQVLC